MKKAEAKPIIEVNISVVNGQVTMNINLPYKWLGIVFTAFILWRVPDLWKSIETAVSLFGK